MKQLTQNLKTGTTELVETPAPSTKSGQLVITSRASVISSGTEKMLVGFGRAGLLSKARQQPEKVQQVLEKMKTDGLVSTLEAVQAKLDQAIPLGYCNAGVVLETGQGVTGFAAGDRVASNGHHAEMVSVPKNLCARIPDRVSDEEAAFTVLGAIALQGVRLAGPTIGESFVVIGLGLVGLLTVQLLQANGCRVLGIDRDEKRLALAKAFGAETVSLAAGEDPVQRGISFSGGRGVDGVLITAATDSNEPVRQAARMSRKRGRIVLVGVSGLELNRADFYEKELSFQVSCSYGPGRYDPNYEEKGHDYPLGFVRWTEQRNMEAVLGLMAAGKLDVKPLITHRFPFDRALEAYDLLAEGREHYLGIVLKYPERSDAKTENVVRLKINERYDGAQYDTAKPVVAMIGSGSFSKQVLLPALEKKGIRLKTIAGKGGLNATLLGRKFGIENSVTDLSEIFSDREVNTLFIATRHDSHADLLIKGLEAKKHVFVEKPLCISLDELEKIERCYKKLKKGGKQVPLLTVGFNRRFSPYIVKMKELTDQVGAAKSMVMTVNAGEVPAEHWVQDPTVGGGRIIGEVCHFIDLLRYLAGSEVLDYSASALDNRGGIKDSVVINLSFADGSIGSINYLCNGHKAYPKEKLELFCGGRILALDNFRCLKGYGWPGFKKQQSLKQQKGHNEEVDAFVCAVEKGEAAPIPFDELVEVTKITILIDQQVRQS